MRQISFFYTNQKRMMHMKKQMKKNAAALLVAALAVSGTAVYAAPANEANPGVVRGEAKAVAKAQAYDVLVNGKKAASAGFMNKETKHLMVPLREIAETLGYEITWNQKNRSAELTLKGTPVWNLVQEGKDEYNLNKMRVKLGAAPVNSSGKLFVPVEFFEECLLVGVSVKGNRIEIATDAKELENVEANGVIAGIINDGGRQGVQMNGAGQDGVVLLVSDKTVITDTYGEKVDFKDLSLGLDIEVKHSPQTMLSLPPQNHALEIKVKKNPEAKEWIGTSGAITDTVKEDAKVRITVKGFGMTEASPEEVVLNLSAETAIVDQNGKKLKADELKKDDKVLAFFSPVLTRSLPPIGNAVKIVVMK